MDHLMLSLVHYIYIDLPNQFVYLDVDLYLHFIIL